MTIWIGSLSCKQIVGTMRLIFSCGREEVALHCAINYYTEIFNHENNVKYCC